MYSWDHPFQLNKFVLTNLSGCFSDFGRLTTDVISSCAFGLDSGCLRDENSKFLVEVKKVFEQFETLPLRFKIFLPLMCNFRY